MKELLTYDKFISKYNWTSENIIWNFENRKFVWKFLCVLAASEINEEITWPMKLNF